VPTRRTPSAGPA